MKIFRVSAERTFELETLVIARDINQAKMLALMAIRNTELEFDSFGGKDSIVGVAPQELTENIEEEIKDYGIINQNAKVEYNKEILEQIIEQNKKQEKEEYLKRNHLEFNFNEVK